MNDVSERVRARPAIVRPRDAASLILLRGAGRDLELLAGRRPGHVKFMPGVYVFPGGAIDREDNHPCRVPTGGGPRPPPPLPPPPPPPPQHPPAVLPLSPPPTPPPATTHLPPPPR